MQETFVDLVLLERDVTAGRESEHRGMKAGKRAACVRDYSLN